MLLFPLPKFYSSPRVYIDHSEKFESRGLKKNIKKTILHWKERLGKYQGALKASSLTDSILVTSLG